MVSEKEGSRSREEQGPGQAEFSGVTGVSWGSSVEARGQRGPRWDRGLSSG